MADLFSSIAMPPMPRPSAPVVPANANVAAIGKAARDFEAMAIDQFLQPMFDTVQTSKGLFGGGEGEEAWKPMLVDQVAKQIAAHGGLGLATAIEDAMRHAAGARGVPNAAGARGASNAAGAPGEVLP